MTYIHLPKDPKSGVLVTSGTDMRIRVWDINNSDKSYVMSDGLRNDWARGSKNGSSLSGNRFSYQTKIVDGVEVLAEKEDSSPRHQSQSSVDPNAVSPCHHDCVTDIVWMDQTNVLVSASRDGVVKLWK